MTGKKNNRKVGFNIRFNPSTMGVIGTYRNGDKKYEYDASLKHRNFNINPYKTPDSLCPEGYTYIKTHKRLFHTVQGYCRKK